MFFKGIKYCFLFLICLFSVNLVLKSQGGSKGSKSPELSTAPRQASPPSRFYDFESDDGLTPVTTAQTRERLARLEKKKSSGRTSPSSPVRGAQTVSPKKPSQLEMAINEAALRRQINEGKKVFDQIQVAQDADIQRVLLQRGGRPKSYDDYLAEGLDSDQAYLRSVGGQQAARDLTVQDLNDQVANLNALKDGLQRERLYLQKLRAQQDLSEDELQTLQRNVQQSGEITKKLNELNERRKKLQEGSIDDAFDRMMASRYPGFGQ